MLERAHIDPFPLGKKSSVRKLRKNKTGLNNSYYYLLLIKQNKGFAIFKLS